VLGRIQLGKILRLGGSENFRETVAGRGGKILCWGTEETRGSLRRKGITFAKSTGR